jgi:hypothetical protein
MYIEGGSLFSALPLIMVWEALDPLLLYIEGGSLLELLWQPPRVALLPGTAVAELLIGQARVAQLLT